jgi:phospholipid/cholesterol/gamma-HCH transport system permease protein
MTSTAAERPPSFVEAIGSRTIGWVRSLGEALGFLGSAALALGRALRFRSRVHRRRDFAEAVQEAGVESLPFVGFVSFLMGGVLAFLAVQQLDRLGALLVAPGLVAIVVLRELAAFVTGICLAGRLASAGAAELATYVAMTSPDGIAPSADSAFDDLVVPRVLALVLMGPLLVVYASAAGLFGSVAVGVGLMDVVAVDYVDRTQAALTLKHGLAGLLKGATFGFVVGVAGCFHGLRTRGGPAGVGQAVRRAVVTAVLGVVVADVALTVFFQWVQL